MPNPASTLIGFALEKLDGETPAKRAVIYRAIAALSATPEEAKPFTALAAECDAIQATHEQMLLDFRRRNRG